VDAPSAIDYREFLPAFESQVASSRFHHPNHGPTPSPLSKKVSIIILTWNALEYTKSCLASLYPTIAGQPVDVLIFDNGSTDGTVEYLKTLP